MERRFLHSEHKVHIFASLRTFLRGRSGSRLLTWFLYQFDSRKCYEETSPTKTWLQHGELERILAVRKQPVFR